MSTDRHALVKKLFLQICDLPEEDRLAALDEACGDDRELRGEVGSLLSFHDETEAPPATRSETQPETFSRRWRGGSYGILQD